MTTNTFDAAIAAADAAYVVAYDALDAARAAYAVCADALDAALDARDAALAALRTPEVPND